MGYEDKYDYLSEDPSLATPPPQDEPLDRDALIEKYLQSKLGRQPEEDLEGLRNKQNANVQLQRDSATTNLMAGLNNASAMFSGGRAKADNSDLEASNKDRMGQIASSNQQLAAGAKQAGDEREKAVHEYLSGKREDARLKQSAENNKNTNLRIQTDAENNLKQRAFDNDAKRKELALKSSSEANRKNEVSSDREDKDASGRIDKLLDHITGSSRGPVGQEKAKLRMSTHALNILKGLDTEKDLDRLSPTMAGEIGSAMAAAISPGHPAESIVKGLTPASSSADLAKAMQYITGNTQEAKLGSQLMLFKHMLERQAQVSKDIINQEYGPMVANVEDLKTHKKWGPRLKNVMEKGGLKFGDDGQLTAFEPNYSPHVDQRDPKGEDGTALAAGGAPKGTVTMKNAKTGETLHVQRADVNSARSEGFKEVQ